MKVTSNINTKNLFLVNKIASESLVETADALETDLRQSKTIPFDTGNLQNRSMFIDKSRANRGVVTLIYDTSYARRLYFHPEYNFQKTKNPNAGGEWFEPYITGRKKDYARKVFAKIMRGKML